MSTASELFLTAAEQGFVHTGLATRVVFGFGTRARVGDELRRLGVSRPLVLSTPRGSPLAQALIAQNGIAAAGMFTGAAMHTPVEVTEKALVIVKESVADGLISLGGGSTIGLGKALAFRTDLPQIVLPTTYSGSEMSSTLGETREGRKNTLRSPKIQAEAVIYDVELTLTLPPSVSATSGMNAIAHAVEGLYAQERNPMISLIALEGIRALAQSLPVIINRPSDRTARANGLYGAWLCGTVLGSVGMALHHKICHVLGGSFGLPHAETHTIILPHAVSFNASAVDGSLTPVAEILHSAGLGQGLFDFAKGLRAPTSLKEIGMQFDGLGKAAALVMESPYYNPRQPTQDEIRSLLEDAFHGRRPEF